MRPGERGAWCRGPRSDEGATRKAVRSSLLEASGKSEQGLAGYHCRPRHRLCVGGLFSGVGDGPGFAGEGQAGRWPSAAGAASGRRGCDPNRFFSSVQIGVTLATLVSGADGADDPRRISRVVADPGSIPVDGLGGPARFVVVTICIAFVSLILGELAPKCIGSAPSRLRRSPRRYHRIVDPGPGPGRLGLLTKSTRLVVAILGGDPRIGRQAMTVSGQTARALVTVLEPSGSVRTGGT